MPTSTSQVPSQKPTVPQHAVIGIVAVLLAAINSSLGGGLLSAGLEDLRGAWGLGIDDAAYIPTAFNASQLFMAPLAIILAARFGHRRVLLCAGVIYSLSSLLLPLVPRTVPTLLFLVISGLASGTFYPLCLSFIARNLPVRLMPFGVAAYSMDLLAGNHVVQSLEGFYMNHFSWHWLFWNQAIFTLPMLFCVYVGIPHVPKDQLLPKAGYCGVLYVSGALTLLFIALDQGERLDWYNNGLINGLVLTSLLLFVAAIVQRRVNPYPFLDFGYLKKRNILILALLMIAVRTILLRAAFIIPLFLERLHQYRPPEIGNLLLIALIPFLVALPVIAHVMRWLHVRYILLIGFAMLAIINFYDAHALSTWIRNDFITQQMIGAVAICMALSGVISGFVFEGRLTGAYKNRAGTYAQGAFFQIARIFGSQSGSAALRRFVIVREHFWQTKLVAGLGPAWPFGERVMYLGTALAPQAAGPLQRPEIATGLIAKSVGVQAFTLAIDDSFMLLAWISVFCLVAVMMMTHVPLPRELPGADAEPSKPPQPAKV